MADGWVQVGLAVALPAAQSLHQTVTISATHHGCIDYWEPIVHEVLRQVDPEALSLSDLQDYNKVLRLYNDCKAGYQASLLLDSPHILHPKRTLRGWVKQRDWRRSYIKAASQARRQGLSYSTAAYTERNRRVYESMTTDPRRALGRTNNLCETDSDNRPTSNYIISTSPSSSTCDTPSPSTSSTPNNLTPSLTYPPPAYSPGLGGSTSGRRSFQSSMEESTSRRLFQRQSLFPIREVPLNTPW